mmetsp:Transcript_14776/g.19628  ORF Transcript_14776/g.19628 Transcript_14776/m.19628 type:complete len:375 (+) Transcript_14776:47-1171(+)|eukprot:CAMPEP_0197296410 /NCGR_PEP_ID=MMETSP0890-20130614/38356_1 /TAXON_ID=44058 ORGANISM="Aureoumbra lagunensis, Strain CCMP1510" /NCGR_SAMPLE_ID=MMETSP0890 /ASSEMBLY_ACC=CAM_ASM_000533 /LENGTH=374 /DNA_ID=CAMNT_0042772957 /DNA_START=23 /DNA_END=1147 /DNA_ORIENTATION=+
MGRKGKKKQEDDDDYFASLTQHQEANNETTTVTMNDEKEEEDEEMIAAILAENERVLEKERLAAKDRAEKAERARLAMAKRYKKNTKNDDDDHVEDTSVPAEMKVNETEASIDERSEDQVSLGRFAQILLWLRPYTVEASLVAKLFTWLFSFLSHFANESTLQAVDTRLALTDSNTALLISQDTERKKMHMLWCPVTRKWIERIHPEPSSVESVVKLSESAQVERWTKNLKTKAKQRGTWTKVKDGEAWASAPNYTESLSKDIPDSAIRYFAYVESDFFDCSAWAISSLGLTTAIVKELDMIDALRPLFTLARDEDGYLVASLHPKFATEVDRLLSQEDGSMKNSSGPSNTANSSKKEKLSRADKKAKKLAYRR